MILAFLGLSAAVGLLAAAERGTGWAADTSSPRVLRAARRIRDRRGSRLDAEAVRRDSAQLLRQLSALLQAGRGVDQAWGDLHAHWSQRRPDHPIVRLCAHAAAGDRTGRGGEEGLRSFLRAQEEHPVRPVADLAFGSGPVRGVVDGGRDASEDREEERLMTRSAAQELNRTVHRLTGVATLSARTGAPLSRLVEQIAGAADDAAELHAQVRTAAAGPRLTQTILSLLPVGGAVIGQLIGADAAAALFGTALGRGCLLVGGLLMSLGWWWSARMITRVVEHV
ncbi:type II secretion system F family protein [Nesterenkonia marinintestina]|uniref:type II secretion system F family protein n=1 Tax=Nesterenkonia marinintestina TaxID=2979865 RepID=UPI0021BE70AE|nr:hypothetical protein [Nesterenkonia sp. GX14115]